MKYIMAFAALFFIAAFQASTMPFVKILGVTPDLVLIFAACWALVRRQGEAMVLVPIAGFLRDLTTSDPLGTSVLALSPIVLLASAAREVRIMETNFLPTLAVVAASSLVYVLISMTVLALTGQEIPWLTALFYVALPAAIVNALFTPILYLPVRWLSFDLRPSGPRLGPSIPT